jgi:sulfate transport system substrate-binding protein
VDPSVARNFHFPTPKKLFSIAHLGGWSSVVNKFFNPSTGIVAKIEQEVGQSPSSGG